MEYPINERFIHPTAFMFDLLITENLQHESPSIDILVIFESPITFILVSECATNDLTAVQTAVIIAGQPNK